MTDQKLSDPPELVALCEEDEDGEERVAGWAMVLPGQVVGYLPPEHTGDGPGTYTFSSLDSAKVILGYSGIYLSPVTDLAMLPGASPAPQ